MTNQKLVPVEPTEFSKGDTDPRGDCGMFVAGINHTPSSSPRDQWGHRIEVYGDTPEHAEELRDRVLRALAAPVVQGEPVAITDADILAIAGRVESCPVSPWWLKDDVAIGDVRAAVLRFARALLVAAPQPAERQEFKRFNGEECWLWAGDGSDRLETLTCSVVITPADLMAIINRGSPAPDVAGLVEELEVLLVSGHLPRTWKERLSILLAAHRKGEKI